MISNFSYFSVLCNHAYNVDKEKESYIINARRYQCERGLSRENGCLDCQRDKDFLATEKNETNMQRYVEQRVRECNAGTGKDIEFPNGRISTVFNNVRGMSRPWE